MCSPRLILEELKPYLARFPATVLVNRELDTSLPNVATINVDDRLGAQQATKYLIERGRKHIALVAGPATSISGQRRLDGYRLGLDTAQRAFDPSLVEYCSPTTEGGRIAVLALFSRNLSIDAIFCFNDLVAAGVIQACAESRRNVPSDVAIIGADDIPLASLMHPALTTLRVDQYQIGHQANSLIMELLKNDMFSQRKILIQPKFIARESA